MVTTRASTSSNRREKFWKTLPALAGALAAHTLMCFPRVIKPVEQVHDSVLSGQMWIEELMYGM